MRVGMMVVGTRGDAQPQVVLARELLARGHQVVMGASPNVVEFARRAGIEARALGPDIGEVLTARQGKEMLAAGKAMAFMRFLGKFLGEQTPGILRGAVEILSGADVLVVGIVDEGVGACLAQAWGIPLVVVHPSPFRPTGAFPAYPITTRQLPSWANRASWQLFGRLWWAGNRATVRAVRAELALPPSRTSTWNQLRTTGSTLVQAYSRQLFPGLDDYGANQPVVGYLTPDPQLRAELGERGLEPELDAWIAGGEPPIYFGFGSMPVLDPVATFNLIAGVVEDLGIRAVLSADWITPEPAGTHHDRIRTVGQVDHDALLPRCRAAVHHGGAGTTAASLSAGLPTVICSVLADQPFWGARLKGLGVGAHLRYVDLDRARLAVALREVLAPAVRDRAGALGARMRGEGSGAGRAADHVVAAFARTAAN